MRQVFDVVQEPSGELLNRLIHEVARFSSCIVLVLRENLGLGDKGQALISRLQPYLIERKRTSSWPGTTLLNEEATILRFSPKKEVLDEIIIASDELYGWQQPELPEDLGFLRSDGTAILASICHEHDAFLEITDEEYLSLTRSILGLADIMRRRPSAGAAE